MADSISRDWVAWGRADPYLAVMGFLPNGQPWQRDAFYASGQAEWACLSRRWNAYGVDANRPVLDLGCGAGRLTAQMAHSFPEVVGVDPALRKNVAPCRDAARNEYDVKLLA